MLNAGFPPLCFARFLLQPSCLWVFLPLILSSASKKHSWSSYDQEIDCHKKSWSCPYVLGHCPSVLWSAVHSTGCFSLTQWPSGMQSQCLCFTDVVYLRSWVGRHTVIPSFWYRSISSTVERMFQNSFFWCRLAFLFYEAYECGEPSAFVLVKSSLNGRLG